MPKPVSPDLWLVAHDIGPCGEAAAQAAARIAAGIGAGIGARLHILIPYPSGLGLGR
jgi:hypothetical protein